MFDTIYEIGFFGLHTAVTVLAYYDTLGRGSPETRDVVGVIILVFLGLIMLCSLVQMWIENIFVIRRLFTKVKMILAKNKENTKKIVKYEKQTEKVIELENKTEENKTKERSKGNVKIWRKRYSDGLQPPVNLETT